MPMISKNNPIHRLNELNEEILRAAEKMAPYYAALRLITDDAPENSQLGTLMVDCLESNPEFRVHWMNWEALRKERDRIHIRLALSYERSPMSEDLFG